MRVNGRGGAEGENAEGQEDTSNHRHDEAPFRLDLAFVLAQLGDSDTVVVVSKSDVGDDTSDDLSKIGALVFFGRLLMAPETYQTQIGTAIETEVEAVNLNED